MMKSIFVLTEVGKYIKKNPDHLIQTNSQTMADRIREECPHAAVEVVKDGDYVVGKRLSVSEDEEQLTPPIS